MFDTLTQDLRYALRGLLATPGFFLVAVATLALGVGSVSAVYSVVQGTLLKPLPYPDAERIVRINREQSPYGGPVSPPVLADWRAGTATAFESMAAFAEATVNLSGPGEAERIDAWRVTPEFWSVMDLPAQAGRYFGADEDAAGERVVVLGHALWQRRYGADPAIVGTDIVINNEAHRVLGVTPPAFRYPDANVAYLPTYLAAATPDRGSNYLSVVARLRPGIDLQQAGAALAQVNARLAAEYPDNNAGMGARLTPLPQLLVSAVRQPLLILLGAAALVLLIACANLANLLLTRGARRQGEMAVRTALGASRGRLLRAVLADAALIALVGGALGIAVAAAAVPVLLATAPDVLPGHSSPGVNLGVVGASLALALASVLAFALWPALQAASVQPAGALKEEGRSGAGGRARGRARSVLVVAEVALSLTLLVGAGLLIESLRQLGRTDAGVDTANVLTAAVIVPGKSDLFDPDFETAYRQHTQMIAGRLDAIVERLAAIPGVEHVGLSDALPLSGRDNISSNVELVGREAPEGGPAIGGANWRFVNPGFFQALGIPVTAGRGLDRTDQRPGEFPNQVLVNQAFARRYLDGSDPVGQQVAFLGGAKTIVGVVGDVRMMGYDAQPVPEVFMAHGNAVLSEFHLALKVRGEPMAYAGQLREALRGIDPGMPVFQVRSLDELAADGAQMRRFNLRLMAVFSAAALLLAAIGLYGVIAGSVAERRHEFGIRLSLGASGRLLLGLVLRQGMVLVGIGMLAGIAGAWALGRALSSQLYGVGAADPAVIASVVLVLGAVALAACLVPAVRAARVDPVVALRSR
jgi:predicted permease